MRPSVMHWNKPVNAARQALAAAAMGRPDADAADLLDHFIGGLAMPRSPGAAKIGLSNLTASLGTMDTPWIPCNPRSIPGPAQLQEI